jgi:hypothetical protein
LRTETVSSKISDALDVAFIETDRAIAYGLWGFYPHTPTRDFRPLTLYVFGAKRRNMKVFAHFFQKVAGFGVEPR